jgi:hypothetical protein
LLRLLTFLCIAYLKKVNKALEARVANKEIGAEELDQFKKGAPAAMKKLVANYDNYDVLMGQSMDGDAMFVTLNLKSQKHILTLIPFRYVLIDFREDGVTPYATVWAHGLKSIKV